MILRLWIPLLTLSLTCASAGERRASVGGVDIGTPARQLIENTESTELARWGATNAWLRVHGLPEPGDGAWWTVPRSSSLRRTGDNPWRAMKRAWAVSTERRALGTLSAQGFRLIPLLRWSNASWKSGVRAGTGQRTPLDLREAFERAGRYAAAYGDVVAALEFDNEPDLMFVAENPETYTAFLKACFLGVRASGRIPSLQLRSFLSLPGLGSPTSVEPGRETRAVTAPIGLPPGPFFEAMVANGFWSYTDAFNYHYYGYAEDFSRVYHLFCAAAEETRPETLAGSGGSSRELPVLLTEYGYGGLTGTTANTVEGRQRQWLWFRDVAEQLRGLRIAGPMAFVLRPYYERDAYEFGLTANDSERWTVSPSPNLRRGGDGGHWTERIGKMFGGNAATPALAWLLDQAETSPYDSDDWTVHVPDPSSVIIDFVAGAGLAQVKRYRGYLGLPGAATWEGELVIYNFSAAPQSGRIASRSEGATRLAVSGVPETLVLRPMERRVVPVRLRLQAERFARAEWHVRFEPDLSGEPASVFSTGFYPDTAGMQEQVVTGLRHDPTTAGGNRERLLGRPLASEEPAVQPAGRWLLTPGVTVTESADGVWRFVVQPAPADGPYLRALAQLPLPDGFVMPDDSALRLGFRLAQPAGADVGSGRYFEIALRTANDNTYVVWPWSYAVAAWTTYLEMKENFGMVFYNRANLPWRFRENRPVALEFGFGRTNEELVFEVRAPRFVKIGKEARGSRE